MYPVKKRPGFGSASRAPAGQPLYALLTGRRILSQQAAHHAQNGGQLTY